MFYQNKITREFGILFVDAKRQTPNMIVPENEKSFGDFEGYEQTNAPEHDPETHGVREVSPVVIGGVLTQQWEVYPLPAEIVENIRRSKIPQACTPAQGLVALYILKGITETQLLSAIGAIPDHAQRYTAQIGFQRATEWGRDSSVMQGMAQLLNLTEVDLDELYTYAGEVQL